MRVPGNHSLSDRLMRANMETLTDEQILIGICADSPNSADVTCEVQGIRGVTKIQICAVAQILRDHSGEILFRSSNNKNITRLCNLIHALPQEMAKTIILRSMS